MGKPKRDYIVIGLTSFPGGGKDYLADILVKKHGFYKVSPGDITREMLKKAGKSLDLTREMQESISKQMIKKYGQNYIMELCYKKILASKKTRIVIPGIRFPSDLDFYRDKFDGAFVNVFVYASRKIRYERVLSRKREVEMSYAEFTREDKAQESHYHLQNTINRSDYKINNNNSTITTLSRKLDDILEEFESKD